MSFDTHNIARSFQAGPHRRDDRHIARMRVYRVNGIINLWHNYYSKHVKDGPHYFENGAFGRDLAGVQDMPQASCLNLVKGCIISAEFKCADGVKV